MSNLSSTNPVEPATLAQQLHLLGLRADDLVMVHASLKRLGAVANGADGVIRAILTVLGEGGTIVMLLGSRDGDIFDPRTSPADPEMGVLAECFRRLPGVRVSDHPACRAAAFGPRAEELLAKPPWHDYYGSGSMLARLTNAGGRVLRLAPNIDTTTLTHYAEYLAKVSPKRRVTRTYITRANGMVTIESLDDSKGIQDWPHGDYFGRILEDYLAAGRAAQAQVGSCIADLFDAQDFVPFAITWMENHLDRSPDRSTP